MDKIWVWNYFNCKNFIILFCEYFRLTSGTKNTSTVSISRHSEAQLSLNTSDSPLLTLLTWTSAQQRPCGMSSTSRQLMRQIFTALRSPSSSTCFRLELSTGLHSGSTLPSSGQLTLCGSALPQPSLWPTGIRYEHWAVRINEKLDGLFLGAMSPLWTTLR